jgi:hypothetical protein
VTTNELGFYEAGHLVSGNYQVTVQASGFSNEIRSGLTLFATLAK